MTVNELRTTLADHPQAGLHLELPNRDFVPAHFHVTEVGRVQKDFIDCGGTMRSRTTCVLQVWVADDTDHRLTAGKLAGILRLGAPLLKEDNLDVEIEYQDERISQYPLTHVEVTPSGLLFELGVKKTECLAPDRCGVGSASKCC